MTEFIATAKLVMRGATVFIDAVDIVQARAKALSGRVEDVEYDDAEIVDITVDPESLKPND